MKASKVLATTILTSVLLAIGGTVAYAEDNPASQEVTSSPESTSEAAQTEPTTAVSDAPTSGGTTNQSDMTDGRTSESSAAPSQPTEKKDAGGSPNSNTENASGSGSPTKSTSGTETPVAATPTTSQAPSTTSTALTDGPGDYHGGPLPTSDTIEIWWAMPYPGNANNVTWPQMYASSQYLQCSITYQVDTYLKTEAQKYTEDGILEKGEDYQSSTQRGAISWRFVYGGDCAPNIPPKPDDKTVILDDHFTKDCEAGTITEVKMTQTTTYVYSEQYMTWVAQVGPPVTETTTRAATEEECPVNTPTTPSSPTTPTTTPTPVTVAVAVPTEAFHTSVPYTATSPRTDTLAKTGSDDASLYALLTLVALVVIGGGTALILVTRRRD